MRSLGDQLLAQPGVELVTDESESVKTITAVSHFAQLAMLVVGIGLLMAALLLILNAIRMAMFARRREIEVMKLVGATNWFIRWPFVIEGVIVGFFGGLLAVLLLLVAKETFIDPLSERFELLAAPETIDFPLLVVALMVACIAVSALGSGITLRRFLRV
jgi:cell division transport system permease protein